jgi:serine protease Do
MEDAAIVKYITYILNKLSERKFKNFVRIFLTSFFSFLIFILICAGLLWYFRAPVFNFLAKEYVAETQNKNPQNKNPITPDSFVVDAVKKTNPAVVSIIISEQVPKYEEDISPDDETNPFGDLFPGFNLVVPQYKQDGTQEEEVGGGSGFLVSSDGLIVTNKHVVDQKNATYAVYTNDGKKYTATVVARDPVLDIALIKITPAAGAVFPYLTLGNSDTLQLGQSVIAIGNALGEYRNTVSVGVVSGLARSITAGDESGNSEVLDQVIQTDAAINPGNSGGPLLDLNGNVIGVNVAVAEGSQSIGFALPINSVKSAIQSVESTGKIIRPYLGVRYVSVTDDIKEKYKLSVDYGAFVEAGTGANEPAVIKGSPADKAGIVAGDVILSIDGVKLDDTNTPTSLISEKSVGQVINLQVLHKGVQENISVTLVAIPDSGL